MPTLQNYIEERDRGFIESTEFLGVNGLAQIHTSSLNGLVDMVEKWAMNQKIPLPNERGKAVNNMVDDLLTFLGRDKK